MFQAVYELAPIWNPQKQLFKIKCQDDLKDLKDMLEKPIVFCATRRQECEAMVNGFDTDFVLVLDPSDPKIATQIKKIIDDVEQKLDCRQKFWLKIDFAGLLDELTMPSSKISFTGSTGSFTSPITANQTRFCNITCGIFGSPCFQFSN